MRGLASEELLEGVNDRCGHIQCLCFGMNGVDMGLKISKRGHRLKMR